MTCVILLWLTCASWIMTYWMGRYAYSKKQAIDALLKVGKQVQDNADAWRDSYYLLKQKMEEVIDK